MRSLLLCTVFSVLLLSSNAQSKPEKGWTALSDGKTFKGWHSYGMTTPGSAWKVQDGAFFLDEKPGTVGLDLTTEKEYENFDLKLEWKISKDGNSGIIFLVHEDTSIYKASFVTGLEMQVLDNDGNPDGKINKHRAGDLYDLIACSKETVKPVGEWNQTEIICNKGKLELYLNGTMVVSTTMWDDNWKQMVAASKFKRYPGFGIFHKGKICLQEHGGDQVWYRNIMIKKL